MGHDRMTFYDRVYGLCDEECKSCSDFSWFSTTFHLPQGRPTIGCHTNTQHAMSKELISSSHPSDLGITGSKFPGYPMSMTICWEMYASRILAGRRNHVPIRG